MSALKELPTSEDFNSEQKNYLDGLFAGIKQRGLGFGDVAPTPVDDEEEEEILCKEERIKREGAPFDAYSDLLMDARHNKAPEPENAFRYKWNGLFYLTPVADSYMCRLRIPGGFVKSYQLRELAQISRSLTSGYIQITTRNNFQIRLIKPKDCPEVLHRIQSAGLHSKGSGGDNIRNITANPTAGIDPHELVDVTPFVNETAQLIVSTGEFYNLPRKFNIAFDGGGLIGAVEDTNDIGCKAVEVGANDLGITPGVYFRIKLGGVTGHKTFATDCGVLIAQPELTQMIQAMLRVFVAHGDRSNRKKARLKYLLEKWGFDKFLEETEKLLPFDLRRVAADSPALLAEVTPEVPHSHVGSFPQKQEGLYYIGAAVPVGQISPRQLERVADLAENYGTGEVRLTVWQNFIIPNVPEAYVATVEKNLRKIGFDTQQSHLKSGFIACTGNRYCKYAGTDTKGHAIALMKHLEPKVKLDQPVNVHFTGCPHSCAQHYMGDIGLLGTKAKTATGEEVEGYHVLVGGGFGSNQKVGRQLFQAMPFEELKQTTETMFKVYLDKREGSETFQAFCNRHDLNELQVLFTPTYGSH